MPIAKYAIARDIPGWPKANKQSGMPILPQLDDDREIIYPRVGKPAVKTNKADRASIIAIALAEANMK